MSGAISPFSQYAFMAWCSVKAQGQLYLKCLSLSALVPHGINQTLTSFPFSVFTLESQFTVQSIIFM